MMNTGDVLIIILMTVATPGAAALSSLDVSPARGPAAQSALLDPAPPKSTESAPPSDPAEAHDQEPIHTNMDTVLENGGNGTGYDMGPDVGKHFPSGVQTPSRITQVCAFTQAATGTVSYAIGEVIGGPALYSGSTCEPEVARRQTRPANIGFRGTGSTRSVTTTSALSSPSKTGPPMALPRTRIMIITVSTRCPTAPSADSTITPIDGRRSYLPCCRPKQARARNAAWTSASTSWHWNPPPTGRSRCRNSLR